MAKRRKRKKSKAYLIFKLIISSIFLLLSISGSILFAFGMLEWRQELGLSAGWAVLAGLVAIVVLSVTGYFTTETAFALKKRKHL